jgi:WD40 repeat protein
LGGLLAFQQWNRRSAQTDSNNLNVSSRPPALKTPTDLRPEPVATHPGVWSVALSPDGTLAASASQNNTITLWDTKTWKAIATLTGHDVVFSPDGKLLAAGGADKTVRLWELPGGRPIEKSPPFPITKPVFRMAFSADSGSLAFFTAVPGRGDTDIRLWDLRSNEGVTLKGESGIALMAIAFSPNSNALFSTAQDNKLRSWNLTEKTSEVLQTYPGALKALVFSPDGKYLACATEDNMISLWSYHSQARKWFGERTLSVFNGEIISLAFSPDSTTLVVTSTSNTIYMCDVASLASQPVGIEYGETMRSPAFSSDPRTFLTVGNNTIWRWR